MPSKCIHVAAKATFPSLQQNKKEADTDIENKPGITSDEREKGEGQYKGRYKMAYYGIIRNRYYY